MERGPTDVPIAPIYLEHYDEAIIRALGGSLNSIVIDGEEAQFYGVIIPGVCGPERYRGLVPIFFGQGMDVINPYLLPQITISRTGVEDDLQRVMPTTLAHKVAAIHSKRIQVTLPDGTVLVGPSRKETKEAAWPVNITYTVQVRSRLHAEMLAMFRWVTSRLHHQDLYSYITVWDSADAPRHYDIFRESMSDISEYIDVNDMVRGYEFSYRVEGEIDIIRPTVHATVVQPEVNTEILEG